MMVEGQKFRRLLRCSGIADIAIRQAPIDQGVGAYRV